MTVNEQIEVIHSRHEDWLKIAYFCSMNEEDAQDILQDLYCRLIEIGKKEGNLDRLFVRENKVNEVYIFQSIRNRCINRTKQLGKITSIEGAGELVDEGNEHILEKKRTVELQLEEIENASKGLKWFDKKLFELYIREGKGYRRLAKDIGLTFGTVKCSIARAKKFIKENVNQTDVK